MIDETAGQTPHDALLAEAALLRAHPAFPAAVQEYVSSLVQFREKSRILSKLNAHEARMRVVGYFLHLSANSSVSGGDGGVSYGDLHDICVARDGKVGPRVLKTMLALLEMLRLVESWRGSDRRVKYYRPTPRLLDFAKGFYVTSARALDRIEPNLGRADLLLHDAGFFARLLVTAGRDHELSPPASRMPGFIAFFGGRDGTGPLTARLVEAELLGVAVDSRAALARQFGLSRTQVSDVIAEGVRLGYFSLDATAIPAVTPQLRDALSRWISIELAFMARHMPPTSRSLQ
jgi:hypothetical protein